MIPKKEKEEILSLKSSPESWRIFLELGTF
jgi:hypothetical protein